MSQIKNMVHVVLVEENLGGYVARARFVDGGQGLAKAVTPEEALVNAVNLAVLDKKFLEENTDPIVAMAEGLSPGALRHVSDVFYRLAEEAKEKQNAVPVPVTS